VLDYGYLQPRLQPAGIQLTTPGESHWARESKIAPMPVRRTPNPFNRFRRWFDEAARARAPLPEAMSLATSGADNRPSVRYVLLKEVDERGFVFYTNRLSRKGGQLQRNPRAALAFYWHATGKQVRCEGRVEMLSAAAADDYWASRPRASQLASLASSQSAPLQSRSILLASVRRLEREYRGRDIPRPLHWIGYRLVPDRVEFWTRREPRLHHREEFVKRGGRWSMRLLQP
jgi:pyridoxamine 5'-phosphate oxidase